jgi:hypothetical protein
MLNMEAAMMKTLTLLAGLCVAGSLTASAPADPETVMVTLRARPGAEAELARVVANHWATARRLDLVRPEPHVTLSAKDAGGTYYVDVFTWRDASIPDNAPAEIKKIWEDMHRLTEARGGHPALTFTEVTVVAPETKPAS